MNSLQVAFNVIFPLIVLISIGYLTRCMNWVSGSAFTQMNKLVFNVLLPCVLFGNVYHSAIGEILNPRLLLFAVIAVMGIFICGIPISMGLTKDPAKRGVVLQALFRSNFVLFGITIVQSLYGDQVAATMILISIIVPMFNILAVIALVIFRNGKVDIRSILLNVCKNPLIIGAAAGLLFSVCHIQLPQVLDSTLDTIINSATPIALIILGGTFQQKSLGANFPLLLKVSLLKLIVFPGIALGIAVALGFRNIELISFVALFGSPAAVSSFSMAQQMGGDGDLAGQNIVITTIASIGTLFLWVCLFSYFKLI